MQDTSLNTTLQLYMSGALKETQAMFHYLLLVSLSQVGCFIAQFHFCPHPIFHRPPQNPACVLPRRCDIYTHKYLFI